MLVTERAWLYGVWRIARRGLWVASSLRWQLGGVTCFAYPTRSRPSVRAVRPGVVNRADVSVVKNETEHLTRRRGITSRKTGIFPYGQIAFGRSQ